MPKSARAFFRAIAKLLDQRDLHVRIETWNHDASPGSLAARGDAVADRTRPGRGEEGRELLY